MSWLSFICCFQALKTVLDLHEVIHGGRVSHPDFSVLQDADSNFGARVMNETMPIFKDSLSSASSVRKKYALDSGGINLLNVRAHIAHRHVPLCI
ncbi:MAG: hypothetical protein HT580_12665 [Dechloromonas sp.]|nr:MAG: hypothetical protein HT580_12665 [Dechloromonas sp.]